MRLKTIEKESIVNAIKNVDPDAAVYLFGSRVDDNQSGGDIDILVCSSTIDFDGKLRIKKKIFESLEEQKIDLIIVNNLYDPFAQSVIEKGFKLG